ncbi:MAG: hypothetical protein QOF43_327 [Gaiellaceae bacterium]|nr:hypothetical protein [Gaiellaceae bacterium]
MNGVTGVAPERVRTPQSTLLAGLALIAGVAVLLWFAPNSYTIYKALHVIAIVIWVGGDITLTTLGIVFERRGDGDTLAALGKLGAWIGVHVYTPAAFAVFAFGVALMESGGWAWGALWVDLALVGWALATGIGVLYVGPELGRIDRAATEHGPQSEEVAQRVARLFTVFRFDTVLLILIVLDMTVKPKF